MLKFLVTRSRITSEQATTEYVSSGFLICEIIYCKDFFESQHSVAYFFYGRFTTVEYAYVGNAYNYLHKHDSNTFF